MREPVWRKTGSTPDYRFSLANERTFLAWIRTSLALIAGALAIDQLAPDIAPAPVRIALCVVLAVLGAWLASLSYRRWTRMEAAMRNNQELPYSGVMLIMTAGIAVAALTVAVLILVAR
ncbi:YidH family protein [Arthrobacter sp. CG_A4]|uniref:YidH family protein n=1 Tax=Arthrobacter sp. CG_A4 TaxID=3071706 RepID=UPI002DFA7690|nr:putative membrane protein [Arthrobacter sp. CG_A4]